MTSFWQILIFLPAVGALIGYVCKWCAIRMLFAPSQFRGIGPIGWQGVVQRRSPKFANGVADTIGEAGITIEIVSQRFSSEILAAKIGELAEQLGPGTLKVALNEVKPGLTEALPAPMQQALNHQFATTLRSAAVKTIDELRPQALGLIDLRRVVVEQLSGLNADRLAKLFQTVGARELRVVIWYGAILGFAIGLLEVGFYAALERWWLLPIIGAIDGLVNNWLAIQMIFRPLEKKRYLGVFPFQGLFPARQDEIAGDYAKMLASDILTIDEFFARIDKAALAELITKARASLLAQLMPQATAMMPMLAAAADKPIDAATLQVVEQRVTEHLVRELQAAKPNLVAWANQQANVAGTLEQALAAMPKAKFERVLRGVFEEDEWILVALGGVLGAAIGMVQGAIVLALG